LCLATEKRGLNQKKLARELDYSESMVSLWLNGHTNSVPFTKAVSEWLTTGKQVEVPTEDIQSLIRSFALLDLQTSRCWRAPLDELLKDAHNHSFSAAKREMVIPFQEQESNESDEGESPDFGTDTSEVVVLYCTDGTSHTFQI